MATIRIVVLRLLLIITAGVSSECAYALAVPIDSGNPTGVAPPVSNNKMIKIAKTVIKTGKGPSSRHPVHQCPPGFHWGYEWHHPAGCVGNR